MHKRLNPSEIAREAIKQLAERHLSPTPANYQMCYNEIARLPNVAGFPEGNLRQVAQALNATHPEQQKYLDQLDKAINHHSWHGVVAAITAFGKADGAGARTDLRTAGMTGMAGAEVPAYPLRKDLLDRLAQTIEYLRPLLGNDDERVGELVDALLLTLRDAGANAQAIQTELTLFNQRLRFVAEEQAEIKHALLKLLQLVIDNIGKLVMDDAWVDGQIDALAEAVKTPLNLRRLDDVERRLEDVIAKQAEIKQRYLDAQEDMRELLGAFIAWLASMNASSTAYQQKLEAGAMRIEGVRTLDELSPVLKDVIEATRGMVENTAKASREIHALQEKEAATAATIEQLHTELANTSAMARHDPLTQVLNRKGLDEALAKEIALMRRSDMHLTLAVLDIDNFKQLNDRLGHKAGDAALIHLVDVIQENLRPSDSLARYGGEEFVILMPDTARDEAHQVMVRLQRELTRRFFLANNEKILITFSAGVVALAPDETSEAAIERADHAMYLAKRAGKNRVVSA
jgi:diguanylate cyclase